MPALGVGELYYATDTHALYIGPVPTQVGGGGVINTATAIVNFGTLSPTEDTTARVTVSAPWVVANQFLVCTVVEGQNHTDDEIAAEQVTATVGNIQAGVGFDVVLSSLNGSSASFLVNISGG